jgi:DNA polymerase III delta prime subunit
MDIWTEKYRPSTLEEYIGNESVKEKVAEFLNKGSIQNLLLYGSAGGGKTSLAKLIVKGLEAEYLYINASDERGIDTIREKIIPFASTISFGGQKLLSWMKQITLLLKPKLRSEILSKVLAIAVVLFLLVIIWTGSLLLCSLDVLLLALYLLQRERLQQK